MTVAFPIYSTVQEVRLWLKATNPARKERRMKGQTKAQRQELRALRKMMTLAKHRPIPKTTRDDDAIELA
jgi:hypothetical protein